MKNFSILILCFLNIHVYAQVTISGNIARDNGDPIVGLNVYAEDIGLAQTDINGDYSFSVPAGYTGTVMPISPFDYGNGINLADSLALRDIILGFDPQASPYQLIAGDINDDENVSTLDLFFLNKLVDGTFNSAMNQSWRFVVADYNFINTNPLLDEYPESFTFNTGITNDSELDFIGAKIGDLDYSANTNVSSTNGPHGLLEGNLFIDQNDNCLNDDEPLAEGWTFSLDGGSQPYVQVVNEGGYFILYAPVGDYTLEATAPGPYWETCQSSVPVTIIENQQNSIDYGVYAAIDCPYMEVELSTPFLRRCFENTYEINYCNNGTIGADDAEVTVVFDDYLEVQSTSAVPTNISDNTYTFALGNIPAGECGTISAVVLVSCEALLGQTHCTEASITPDELCNTTSSLWSGADLELSGACENGEVVFRIENVGDDMDEPTNFIIIEDILVKNQDNFQLGAGEMLEMSEISNGTTCRIEVDQIAHHPSGHRLIEFVEGCGTHPDGSVSLGFITQFEFDGGEPFTDVDCRVNIGAYDPNDIQGFPTGYSNQHFIDKDQDLEYLIRFQNTGTDTAFNIRIENPLPENLDWSTLRPLVSSHDFDYVFQNNKVVFHFRNIMLPDSNINEAASHGFIRYAIQQNPAIEIGDVIENQAAIYFDFNEPIITNIAFHTIGEELFTVEATEVFLPNVDIKYYPNPVSDQMNIELTIDQMKNGQLDLYDAQGKLVKTEQFESTIHTVDTHSLQGGLYFFYLTVDGKAAASGKLVKQ